MWGVGEYGGREQRAETGVFKAAEQSVLGGAILGLALWILFYSIFYKKERSLSDEEVMLLYCSLTSTHTVSPRFICDPLPSFPLLVSFKSSFSSQPQPVPCLNCFNPQVLLILILNS